MENVLNPIFLFIFGSCIGSFLNVYIFRYPKSISIVYPRSFCPKCKKKINWYDNVPIFSYLLLGGKCRRCKKIISQQYLIVELLSIICFVNIYCMCA